MDERPLLTFDMDGVLCRPPFGVNPGSGHGKRRDTAGKKGLLWFTERWRYHFRKPMPGAVEGFRALQEVHRCVVVTARSAQAEGLTRGWFRKYFGFEPELHMRPGWIETSAQYKARKMHELSPIAHFEDDPFTAKWVAEIIPSVFLMDWPRNVALSGENIYRIRSLEEAVKKLS